jgi:hypothetical protein
LLFRPVLFTALDVSRVGGLLFLQVLFVTGHIAGDTHTALICAILASGSATSANAQSSPIVFAAGRLNLLAAVKADH